MRKSPLTGTTTGDFDSLRVRHPAHTGSLVSVASLVAGAAYDDTQIAAAVAVNSASTAANSANIAGHASTLAQHASDISGKANASDLQTPVPAGAVFSDSPLDVWHSGSSQYIPTTKVYYENSSLTLDAGAGSPTLGAWFVKAQPGISEVSGLQAALDGKINDSQVLTNVPLNAVFTDSVYSHPATHSIAEVSGLQTVLDGKVDDSQVLTNVPLNAVFTDSVYSHPATHSIAEVSGLQTALGDTYTKLATDDLLNDKRDTSDSYSISEIDTNIYTKVQTNDHLNDKRDISDSYSISEIDANTYTKAQVDDRLDDKADSSDLLQVYSGSNTWAEPTKIHFDNCSFAIDVAPGSATLGAWIVDPQPPMSSVTGLTAAMAGKQPAITESLSLGTTAPLLSLTRGAETTQFSIDAGLSTIIHWGLGSGAIYAGYKRAGSWSCWISSSNNSWSSASDARLKNILGPLEFCTTKLQSINPCYFEYTGDATRKRRIGLIAQECQVHFPETVAEGPGDGQMLGMSYGDLVPVLIQAIKELTVRVEALEGKRTKKNASK